jgi:hypothetical protein
MQGEDGRQERERKRQRGGEAVEWDRRKVGGL